MKIFYFSFFQVLITLIFCSEIFGQGSISGRITDKGTKETLVGASVLIKGTNNGTITDLNGYFKLLNVNPGEQSLVVSSVGYRAETFTVNVNAKDTTKFDVSLTADVIGLEQVVVTGVVNSKSALKSSLSITSMQSKAIDQLGAVSTAEIFKSIAGVHSESTGGEGNANISVRGVPISTGGSKFLQLHEDGLPVLQFGDISFGNADIFLRSDQTVARIEAIRGGSASTFASNSPAGIINFISKNGSVEGGSIGTTFGLDYKDFRTDFEYGGPIGKGFRFNIGGFYRQGEGPRTAGFDGNLGGQIKANITKDFKDGYVRLYFKHLDDRTISYMPMPVAVSGTGSDPTFSSIPGFDLSHASLQSSEFFNMTGVDAYGNTRTTNISDGMHPVSNAVGSEFSFDLAEGWKITNKNRMALTNGSFRTLFPMQIGTADAIAKSVSGSSNYVVSYANGVNAGKALSNSQLSNLNGNGLLMTVASFDVDINSLNNFTNDFYLSKQFDEVNLTAGFYKAYQEINMTWLWQQYTTDVQNQPKLINIASADGSFYTEGGYQGHGVPLWGNCCTRAYDMKYDIDAPYANASIDLSDQINVDASIRYDFGTASGYYLGNHQTAVDVNHDGTISPVEKSVTVLDNVNPHSVGYDYGYLSYSLGANYKIDNSKAVYGRYSRGGRANADRLLYSQFITPEGKAADGLSADMVSQAEVGFKLNNPKYGLMITGFYSDISEQNYEATSNKVVKMGFNSFGAEVEGSLRLGGFNATASATFTKAKISSSLTASEVGNTPRRVPTVMYNINPSYTYGKASIGFSIIGTTKVYSQNDNAIVLPAFAYTNAFASYEITKGLTVMANVNNLFNTLGFTEMEGDAMVNNQTNYMRARPITGRASTLSITYKF